MSTGRSVRVTLFLALTILMVGALNINDGRQTDTTSQERLYFPSGKFLREASLGFREAAADYLWFRLVQYYGGFAKDQNDLRYFDQLIDSITRLDPRFVEAYHFASLVRLSDFGDIDASLDLLKRGILHNPDTAKLHFQTGFLYYVFLKDYARSATWFEAASRCSDATDKEQRFAAFARHRAGDDRVSLALWEHLLESTSSPQMKELALKMIEKTKKGMAFRQSYGDDFIGPIPEL